VKRREEEEPKGMKRSAEVRWRVKGADVKVGNVRLRKEVQGTR